jgi:hypothetical protein
MENDVATLHVSLDVTKSEGLTDGAQVSHLDPAVWAKIHASEHRNYDGHFGFGLSLNAETGFL